MDLCISGRGYGRQLNYLQYKPEKKVTGAIIKSQVFVFLFVVSLQTCHKKYLFHMIKCAFPIL